MALYSVVFIGSTPIGGPITGWLAGAAGPRAGLVMGGIAAVAAGVVAQRAFMRGIAAAGPDAADAPAGAPAVAVATAGEGRRRTGGKSMHRRGLSIGLRHRMADNCTSNYFYPHQRSTDVRHHHRDHAARRDLDR
jgi:hypothetical protein